MMICFFAIAFLFVGLPNPGDCKDLQCFISGECTNSQHLDVLTSEDEFQCLESCQNTANCTWFSFFPNSQGCHLMSSCGSIDDTFCPNCISGQRECEKPAPICFVKGNYNLIYVWQPFSFWLIPCLYIICFCLSLTVSLCLSLFLF